mmetsp:Transcript_73094/g.136608  ORF Transcript_73094/g.136608 Transcript_73094/m.136608 type:complete len:398 (-) Transcript_73094:77-1270(-)
MGGSSSTPKQQSRGQKYVEAKLAALERTGGSVLEISGEAIRDHGVELITAELKKATCLLTKIRLEFIETTSAAFVRLAEALVENHTVKSFGFIRNTAADVVDTNEDADIPEADKPERSAVTGSMHFRDALLSNPTLECIEFDSNDLCDVNALLFADGLEANRSVKEFVFRNNALTPKGVSAIGKALLFNPTLTKLDLSENHIDADGCNDVMQALQSSTTALQEVSLRAGRITEEACRPMRDMLSVNRTLKVLNLRRNALKDGGCMLVAEGLAENRTLTSLHLASNMIGKLGFDGLSAALESNTALEELWLEINNLEDLGLQRFSQMLEKNSSLKKVDLRMNNFQADGLTRLADAVEKNDTIIYLPMSKSIVAAKASISRIESKVAKNARPAETDGGG